MAPIEPFSKRRICASFFSSLACYARVVYFFVGHRPDLHPGALILIVISPALAHINHTLLEALLLALEFDDRIGTCLSNGAPHRHFFLPS
jgi:hypothetical protein